MRDGGRGDRVLRVGTRGSTLALIQARYVAERLAAQGTATEIVVIRTEGDERPVDTAWGEGAFVGRIVAALLEGEVDLAVHSAKDVPTDEHPQLVIAAYPSRADARDALVTRGSADRLDALPPGARVGTDSPRRRAFLLAARPDLQVHPLHGNVDTRLAKLDRGETDALILAVAGLDRLGRNDRISQILPADTVAPAPGQGALAVQVRADDRAAQALVAPLDDPVTRSAVVAERTMLNATGGGCRSPIGALASADGDRLDLLAAAERTFSPAEGALVPPAPVVWLRDRGDVADPRSVARRLAARVVAARGGARVLVARATDQAVPLLQALAERGLDSVHVPAIEIASVPPGGALDAALGSGPDGATVVVTSANAAAATTVALERVGRAPDTYRWAAVGPATAATLAERGISDVFVPGSHTGAGLATELPLQQDAVVLLPRADIADDALPAALRARGAHVEAVEAYRTLEAPASSRPLLRAALEGPIDAIVHTSGSTARGLLGLAADEAARERLRRIPVIAIGRPTAEVAEAAGYHRVLTSPAPGVAALATYTAEALGLTPTAVPEGAA